MGECGWREPNPLWKLRGAFCTSFRAQAVPYSVPWEAAPNCGYWIEVRNAVPKRRLRKSRSSSVDELAAVIAYGVVLNQLSWNWRECWQPAGSHASHWVARVGQARRCEASAWMSRRPSAAMVETLDHCGEPRAAGGADTSLAWYQLRARKRATIAKKS